MAKSSHEKSVRLRPHDAFDLIRWLARSQSDPRKAVAELVQNSLDAQARHVRVSRRRVRGLPALVVEDDGAGVLPEMGREEALDYLATHIGHSRKFGLTPSERAKVVGQYGVGLLGFWAIGKHLELRTRVGGGEVWALRLAEDDPHAAILRLPSRLDVPPAFTEAIVAAVHPPAQRVLGGRRLADYLAAELRGQLLRREVELTVHDGVARGLSQKLFTVVPRRFLGERLGLPEQVPVDEFAPLYVELYLARGAERPAIQLACAGTLVADDIGELAALGLAEAPWVGRSLTGILDFADFHVPPGTRRGVVPDRAAAAFVTALERLRPAVEAELARLDRERAEAADRDTVRELRRALRGFRRRLPQYELPAVSNGAEPAAGHAAEGEGLGEEREPEPSEDTVEMFAPGPLDAVRISPDPIRVEPAGERRVQASAADAEGRRLREGVSFAWSIEGAGLSIQAEDQGARVAVKAAGFARPETMGTVRVSARAANRSAEATAAVTVAEHDEDDDGKAIGIPEPEPVSDPTGPWRSRMLGEHWQINDAHEDYLALRSDPRARMRYLLGLFAKEIVHRSYGKPGDDTLLERLVEILAHAERNLRRDEGRTKTLAAAPPARRNVDEQEP